MGKVFDEAKWWCTQHSPAKEAERRQQSDERYAAKTTVRHEQSAKEAYDRTAGNYCRALGLTLDDVKVAIAKAKLQTDVTPIP